MTTRSELVADCGRCAALCCVAPAFDAGDEFAFDKPAGVRCRNLTATNRCGVHGRLVSIGFPGCVAYDCHGAGQRATTAFVNESAPTRHAAFLALTHVHELMWLLDGARRLCPESQDEIRRELAREIEVVDALGELAADALIELNLRPYEARTDALLRRLRDVLPPRQ